LRGEISMAPPYPKASGFMPSGRPLLAHDFSRQSHMIIAKL
jgi:hypothetical protein